MEPAQVLFDKAAKDHRDGKLNYHHSNDNEWLTLLDNISGCITNAGAIDLSCHEKDALCKRDTNWVCDFGAEAETDRDNWHVEEAKETEVNC